MECLANVELTFQDVDAYQCPNEQYWRSRRPPGEPIFTSYAAAIGPHALLSSDEPRTFSGATDGVSNTIMLLEVCGQGIVWSEPRDIDISQTPLGINLPGNAPGRSAGVLSSQHRYGGAHVVMGDAAARYLKKDTDPMILERLLQRDDGKPVGNF